VTTDTLRVGLPAAPPPRSEFGADESRLLARDRITAFPAAMASGTSVLRSNVPYSGGAAPASHRFPWLSSALFQSKLLSQKRSRKRGEHRTANNERQQDHVVPMRVAVRARDFNHRNGGCRHFRSEKSSELPALHGYRLDFLQLGSVDICFGVFDKHFEDRRRPREWESNRKRLARQ
jgi:hypothetical protein